MAPVAQSPSDLIRSPPISGLFKSSNPWPFSNTVRLSLLRYHTSDGKSESRLISPSVAWRSSGQFAAYRLQVAIRNYRVGFALPRSREYSMRWRFRETSLVLNSPCDQATGTACTWIWTWI